jgi:hypothetical protein
MHDHHYACHHVYSWDLSQAQGFIPDVPLGVRVLANMAAALEAVAGKTAVQVTPVILHLDESQLAALDVLKEYSYGGCGIASCSQNISHYQSGDVAIRTDVHSCLFTLGAVFCPQCSQATTREFHRVVTAAAPRLRLQRCAASISKGETHCSRT